MKDIIKRIALAICIFPLWLIVAFLSIVGGVGKYVYKISHACACKITSFMESLLQKAGV